MTTPTNNSKPLPPPFPLDVPIMLPAVQKPPEPLSTTPPAPIQVIRGGVLDMTLNELGVYVPGTLVNPRIIADLSGGYKTSKSYTALTAPEPIMVLAFDPSNLEGVVEEFVRLGKQIVVKNMQFDVGASQSDYQVHYQELINVITYINKNWPRGTIIVDTGQELELLIRLSLFGKIKGVGTYAWEARNSEMEAIFRLLTNNSLNVLFLHNMKKQWVQGQPGDDGQVRSAWTGNFEPDRPDILGKRVQINMETYREQWNEGGITKFGAFHVYIGSCRLASSLAGTDYKVPMGGRDTIPKIMSWIFQRAPEEFV